jgi:hypothetical protein
MNHRDGKPNFASNDAYFHDATGSFTSVFRNRISPSTDLHSSKKKHLLCTTPPRTTSSCSAAISLEMGDEIGFLLAVALVNFDAKIRGQGGPKRLK